ncbi:MAG: CPBP family intramembrane metalloprotease [Alphaproteobacteria bacterium]|nr:CPBP family intramembrane metalloprotease [Alphaproteobacteria bacterium]MBL6937102.1 CPBP family intramembrane metalloprotease [Alphaproteobacteria bacterium]MBL7096336.1 CPBP family intramembrane metalloprotease [Alphaproteobacteria bacterium]
MVRLLRCLAAVILVVVLGLGLPIAGAVIEAILSYHAPHIFPAPQGPQLSWLYAQHFWQTALALVAIFLIRIFFRFDAGLRWPQQKTYIWPAILWGAFFGVLMTVVDYLPDLLARHPMNLGFPLTRENVIGWTFFEGVYVGPTEEILFRSLLVGFLMAAMPWKFTVGRYSMHWAGAIVAAIFAFAHIASFFTRPSFAAAGQQLYAFALGLLYAYWFEKSRSVVAPIIGHNVSDVVEYAICFVLIALWS